MEYTEIITEAAYRSTVDDVAKLRNHGWTEDQISEAVYVIAMSPSSIASPMPSECRRSTIWSSGR